MKEESGWERRGDNGLGKEQTEYIAEWARKLKNGEKGNDDLKMGSKTANHFMEMNACPGAVCSAPE
jgi:hypothetical protein